MRFPTPREVRYAEVYEMSLEAIDRKLEAGQAQPLRKADVRDWTDSPAIRALSDVERDVWRMRAEGIANIEIARLCGLRRDQVCRMAHAIHDKIRFLSRFQDLLTTDRGAFAAFLRRAMGAHADHARGQL